MKKLLALLALTLIVGLQAVVAQTQMDDDPPTDTPKVHLFDGNTANGLRVQVVYSPDNEKLGLITLTAQGEPISAYMFYGVTNVSERFYRTAAETFGKVEGDEFVYFELSGLTGSSINISVDSGETESLTGQDPVEASSLRPFGNCRNYCYPSNPGNYNWWQCFWCCATTGRDPCSNM